MERLFAPGTTLRVLLPVLLLLLWSLDGDAIGAENRPNILFFLSDDHRWDRMGCAGHPILQTPTMDKMAKEGVRFSNMFVTTSICAASRATLLTGLYERTHGFTFGTPPISKTHIAASYPALLKKAGYRTGFVGKFGVNIEGPEATLFDTFVPLNRNPYFKKQADGSLRHLTEITGDKAIAFLDGLEEGRSFCLSISFNAAHAEDSDKENHYPWPEAENGLYDDAAIPAPRLSAPEIFESQPEVLRNSMNRDRWFWRWDTPEKYQKNIRAYYRMITGLDRVMGRVLQALEKRGLADNTVVIFAGDNGYYEGQRGFAGKWSHFEESLRVPLLIYDPRAPRERRGVVEERMALNADVAPTILAYAGLDIPEHYQGWSLVPLMRGEKPAAWRKDTFCEHLMDHPRIPKWEGVRAERYVYARYFEQQPVVEMLHDLETDADQLKNFAGDPDYEEVLEKMRSRCDALRDRYGGVFDVERVRRWNAGRADN